MDFEASTLGLCVVQNAGPSLSLDSACRYMTPRVWVALPARPGLPCVVPTTPATLVTASTLFLWLPPAHRLSVLLLGRKKLISRWTTGARAPWVKGGAKWKRVLPKTEQALALVPPCVLTPTNQHAL